MNKTINSHNRGQLAEKIACAFLADQKLKLIKQNYRTPRGEIDLIMHDGNILVFIEVRSRTNNRFLDVVETIDGRKRNHIIYASQYYLQKHRQSNHTICRFDLVLLTGPLASPEIEWIKNAFDA